MTITTRELFTQLSSRHPHYCVVPYGRSFDEYCRMFSLVEGDRSLSILGVGDGPASFNAEASNRGWRVVSVDPIYQFPAAHIRDRFDTVVDTMVENAWAAKPWLRSRYESPASLRAYREQVLEMFVKDIGKGGGRYVAAGLPRLPFGDGAFDLVLSSYLLFVYTKALDLAFHLEAIAEMLRVAREVRLFPVAPGSSYLQVVLAHFTAAGCQVQTTAGASEGGQAEGFALRLERAPRAGK